jgi:hypothetical protein
MPFHGHILQFLMAERFASTSRKNSDVSIGDCTDVGFVKGQLLMMDANRSFSDSHTTLRGCSTRTDNHECDAFSVHHSQAVEM